MQELYREENFERDIPGRGNGMCNNNLGTRRSMDHSGVRGKGMNFKLLSFMIRSMFFQGKLWRIE